jgi:diguanylate cyclase (GGDEF)-like protein
MYRESTENISRGVFVEMVQLLFTARWPLVVIGVSLALAGATIAYEARDPTILVLGLFGLVISLGRLLLVEMFERSRRANSLTFERAKAWERRFGVGASLAAASIGAFAVRAFLLPSLTAHMLATGLVFGFCAGVATRNSVRPLIAKASICVAVVPTALASLWCADLNHYTQSFLFIVFFAGSLETVGHLYRTTLEQLTLKAEATGLARVDVLTELPNRLRLREHAESCLEDYGRNGKRFAVILIDLDYFKNANDQYGHAVGDEILRTVASRLVHALRVGDLACRLGGDEFIVIQKIIADETEVEMLSRRLVKALAAPYSINGEGIALGASVGVAIIPQDGKTCDELLERADRALYAAKRRHRERVREDA